MIAAAGGANSAGFPPGLENAGVVLAVPANPAIHAGPGWRKNIDRTESVGMLVER
jgi:hypothetical protein